MADFDLPKIRQTIATTIQKLQVEGLSVDIEWKTRFTRKAGDARYYPALKRGRIRLSVPLWPRMPEAEKTETIVHELCHLIANHKFGRVQAHGQKWKLLMRMAGYPNARRCHTIDRTGLGRKVLKYKYTCTCSGGYIGPKRFQKWLIGEKYTCRTCRSRIIVNPVPVYVKSC